MRFAHAYPGSEIFAIDAAQAMLDIATKAISVAGLDKRIHLLKAYLPMTARALFDLPVCDTIISNSLLHHLRDPQTLWRSLTQMGAIGAAIFIMDLVRPPSRAAAAELVERHAASELQILKRDFFNSLLAAYRVEEIRDQLTQSGLANLQAEVVSDHHLLVDGYLIQ